MQTYTHTSTQDVADQLGLTYRQTDYLIRNGVISDPTLSRGSGSRRTWPADVIVRLHIAKAIHEAAPMITFHEAARAVMATDTMPPPKGLVVLRRDGTVEYADNPVTLVAALGDGGVVADYELPHAA